MRSIVSACTVTGVQISYQPLQLGRDFVQHQNKPEVALVQVFLQCWAELSFNDSSLLVIGFHCIEDRFISKGLPNLAVSFKTSDITPSEEGRVCQHLRNDGFTGPPRCGRV